VASYERVKGGTKLTWGPSPFEARAPGITPTDTVIEIPDSGVLPEMKESPYSDSDFGRDRIRPLIPRYTIVNGLSAVWLMTQSANDRQTDLWLVWVPGRSEWICILHSSWWESDAYGTDESYGGPYKLSPHHAKILEGYGVSPAHLPIHEVVSTSPDQLVEIRHQEWTRSYGEL
jgi:hypothetical protein